MGGRYVLRSILNNPIQERVEQCISILKNESDESLRVEALWVFADTFSELDFDNPLRKTIADTLEYVLMKDDNGVVKHEVCYLIGENNLRNKISVLREAIVHDPDPLVKHEAIEALGLLQDFKSIDVLKYSLDDPNPAVSQTAAIVLKQLSRASKNKSKKI